MWFEDEEIRIEKWTRGIRAPIVCIPTTILESEFLHEYFCSKAFDEGKMAAHVVAGQLPQENMIGFMSYGQFNDAIGSHHRQPPLDKNIIFVVDTPMGPTGYTSDADVALGIISGLRNEQTPTQSVTIIGLSCRPTNAAKRYLGIQCEEDIIELHAAEIDRQKIQFISYQQNDERRAVIGQLADALRDKEPGRPIEPYARDADMVQFYTLPDSVKEGYPLWTSDFLEHVYKLGYHWPGVELQKIPMKPLCQGALRSLLHEGMRRLHLMGLVEPGVRDIKHSDRGSILKKIRAKGLDLNVSCLISGVVDSSLSDLTKSTIVKLAVIAQYMILIIESFGNHLDAEDLLGHCNGTVKHMAHLGGIWTTLSLWETLRAGSKNFKLRTSDTWRPVKGIALDVPSCQTAFQVIRDINRELGFEDDFRDDFEDEELLSAKELHFLQRLLMWSFLDGLMVIPRKGRPFHMMTDKDIADCYGKPTPTSSLLAEDETESAIFGFCGTMRMNNRNGELTGSYFTRLPADLLHW
ncbi:hypothetical protein B0T17DRAFT_508202 [Bombardia bombarda]|uniref:Uncharacterized protein n=1 Tax=Bombardia bombarda TaxID=252184 RepID=A0AA39X0V1_9PEZI|nr:hypothetical protein B0T17DRAFT_508202 [Bombardia bombarda]